MERSLSSIAAVSLEGSDVTIDRMESLEEINHWLGTFTERLRIAREHEHEHIAGVLRKLEAQYKRRRAELA
jgi:hypothetical protein